MAFTRGGKGAFLVDNAAGTPVDITLFIDSVDWGDFSTESLDTSTYGTENMTYIPGLSNGSASIAGKYDAVTGGPDETLRALRGKGPLTIEWQPEGPGAGKPYRRAEAILTSYASSAPVGEIITFSASWQISGPETTGALV